MGDVVFLDRDGTINVRPAAGDYIRTWTEFRFLRGAADAVRALTAAGRRVVIVTNQRGIALGRMTEADLADIHRRMLLEIGPVAAIYHCPHDDGRCGCRKPRPGMLLRAARDLARADLARSTMIGDSLTDMQAGRAVGAQLIAVSQVGVPVDHSTTSLAGAVEWLLAR